MNHKSTLVTKRLDPFKYRVEIYVTIDNLIIDKNIKFQASLEKFAKPWWHRRVSEI